MQRTRIEDVDSWMGPASVKRSLTRALGAEDVAINYYELDPGESFAFGYHRHADQEEVFYVLEGEATFETGEPRSGSESASSAERSRSRDGDAVSRDDETSQRDVSNHSADRSSGRSPREDGETASEDDEVTVGAGEAVRFGPGEWQQGWNRGESRVKALALGAPRESGETTILRECSECGERTGQEVGRAEDADALVTACVDCGAETGRFT